MQKEEIADYIVDRYQGLVAVNAWGEQSFFYNPEGKLPWGVYFATLKDKDGDNDRASGLGRTGVFRFNFGISKPSYEKALGERPSRPVAGGVVDTGHDFTRLNTLLPHPVYGWMSWVGILNPDREVFRDLQPLLNESYELVVGKYRKRVKS
ncbi:DUF6194 family protein [Microbulbifer halophilus]|uniref:DUF6194 family protein n=1 Tax=Microbulbifer halophilus TaxID=453963 RepID=A0ABW5EFV5_9GAMM|nr:DUF6194 family protein [Microbulbifer halophilus]MCW8127821.1 DUF6194 family protein [Microbulbifer halophilus]